MFCNVLAYQAILSSYWCEVWESILWIRFSLHQLTIWVTFCGGSALERHRRRLLTPTWKWHWQVLCERCWQSSDTKWSLLWCLDWCWLGHQGSLRGSDHCYRQAQGFSIPSLSQLYFVCDYMFLEYIGGQSTFEFSIECTGRSTCDVRSSNRVAFFSIPELFPQW